MRKEREGVGEREMEAREGKEGREGEGGGGRR